MSVAEPKTPHGHGIVDTLDRLNELSVDTYYNPYKMFQWPETLPERQWWMSPELMTVAGTRYAEELSEDQLMALSKWESIHFYSLNVHGIRELLLEVIKRVHETEWDEESEFFHHFIGEENEHMWFFATFCLNYGHKIYPSKSVSWAIQEAHPDIESFLVFSRILIFEEIVDYFNIRMGRDETLHPIIQQVNAIHHQDESRHIAFGREIVKKLFEKVSAEQPAEDVQVARDYLQRYIKMSIESLYNPAVYRDAGLPEPYQMRTDLVADPVRREANHTVMKRTMSFLLKNGIVESEDIF